MESEKIEYLNLLKFFFSENIEYCKHHETLRASVTNIIIIITAALLSVASLENNFNEIDAIVGLFVFIIGIYGAIFTLKHYERYRLHNSRLNEINKLIQQHFGGFDIKSINENATNKQKKDFPILSKIRLHIFWVSINIAISIIGIGMVILVLL